MARVVRLGRKLLVAGTLLLVAPSLWNLAGSKWKHAQNPPPGTLHSVHGHRMHIYCTGEGSPTVIMEAAASATWLAWRRVQPQLSSLTRVCAYDRAGHGWSELRSGPRDAQTIARELHALLD